MRSLEEFTKHAQRVYTDWGLLNATTHPWFRGQTSSSWGLVPGLYRGSHDPQRERELLRDFKSKSMQHLQQVPNSNLEWLFVVQHFGMPTRLLDWTESYQMALFFAVRDSKTNFADGVVWVLNPWALNSIALGQKSVPIASSHELAPYDIDAKVNAEMPVAVRPSYYTKRASAQKGVFTLHGTMRQGLDELTSDAPSGVVVLKKIIIASEAKKHIMKQLAIAGVGSASLFQDLDGLASELTLRYSNDYLNEADENLNEADENLNEVQKKKSGPLEPEKKQKATVTLSLHGAPTVKSLPLSPELPAAPLAPFVRGQSYSSQSTNLSVGVVHPNLFQRLLSRFKRFIRPRE